MLSVTGADSQAGAGGGFWRRSQTPNFQFTNMRIAHSARLLALATAAISASAQCPTTTVPRRLADLTQGPAEPGANCSSLVEAGPWLYYDLNEALMRTQGPGTTEVVLGTGGRPVAALGNDVLFDTGYALWIWNAASGAATRLVEFVGFDQPVVSANGVFFVSSADLWFTDGTPAGTRIVTPPSGVTLQSLRQLTRASGGIYLTANDGVHGVEIWRATPNTLTLVCDANPGPASSQVASLGEYTIRNLQGFWDTFLLATVGFYPTRTCVEVTPTGFVQFMPGYVDSICYLQVGAELRMMIAGPGGVHSWNRELQSPLPGMCGSYQVFFGVASNATPTGFFLSGFQLHHTTGARTVFGLGQCYGTSTPVSTGTTTNIQLDPSGEFASGWQGTQAVLYRLNAGGPSATPLANWSAGDPWPVRLGSDVYHVSGGRLYRNGAPWTELLPMTNGGSSAFFGPHPLAARGFYPAESGLWRISANPASAQQLSSGGVTSLAGVGPGVLFTAHAGANDELWRTSGSGAASLVTPLPFPSLLTSGSGTRLFGIAGFPYTLWSSDGTAAGTQTLAPASTYWHAVANGTAYFFGNGMSLPFALWRSDGTPAGTVRMADLPSANPPDGLVMAGGRFLMGLYGPTSLELWQSDGTSSGTSLLRPLTTSDMRFVEHGGATFLLDGHDLVRTDGTPAGTTVLRTHSEWLRDLVSTPHGLYYFEDRFDMTDLWKWTPPNTSTHLGSCGFGNWGVVSTGDWLFFAGSDAARGCEVWALCCATGALGPLGDITEAQGGSAARRFSSHPSVLGILDGKLLVEADDLVHGHEPWVFDLPGAIASLGTGLGSNLRSPALSSNVPRVGSNWNMTGAAAPVGSYALLMMSLGGAPPTSLFGHTVFLDLGTATVAHQFPVLTPSWSFAFAVPPQPWLIGINLTSQAAFLGAAIESTNALAATIGP